MLLPAPLADSQSFALHPAQQNIYFEQLLYPDSPVYNLGWYTLTTQPYDLTRLQQSWDWLTQHLDALRLVIIKDDDDMPMQSIKAQTSETVGVQMMDFTKAEQPLEQAKMWMQQQLDQSLGFIGGQTCQVALIALNSQQSVVFTRFHHLVIDSAGVYQLHRHLHHLYHCLSNNLSIHWLASLPQYAAALNSAHQYLNSPDYQQDKAYWVDFMANRQSHRLTAYYSISGSGDYKQGLSDKLTASLQLFCQSHQVSPLAVITAVISLYFARVSAEPKQLLATAVHGRQDEQMQVVGMFANVIPIACDVDENLRFIVFAGKRSAARKSQPPAFSCQSFVTAPRRSKT
jgi:hypothetical protein